MLCLLCFVFFLLSSLVVSAVMLCVFAGMACNFFPQLAHLIELLVSYFSIWSEIMIYLFCGFLEFVDAIIRLCVHVSPLISRGWNHICNSFPYIMNDILHTISVGRTEIWDFILSQREWIIYCWGLLLVPLYIFKNQVHNIFQRNRGTNQDDRRHHWAENEADYDHDDEYNINDAEFIIDNRRFRNDNLEQNVRHRHKNRPQRLYPVLPNDSDDSADDDDSPDDYVHVDYQDNASLCVVCFQYDRNTAVFPCGHTQSCEQCVRNIMTRNKRCPVCQRHILEYRTVYL